MSSIRAKRTHAILRAYRSALSILSVCMLASTILVAGVTGSATTARADSSIGSPNGEIFHRKGWDQPAIYRKAPKAKEARTPRSSKTAAKSKRRNSNRTPRRVTAGRGSSKLRHAARARLPKARRYRVSAKRRIPARVVKRLERKITLPTQNTKDPHAYAIKVASLGVDLLMLPPHIAAKLGKPKKSITGGGRVTWAANSRCLPARLRAAIYYVARNFGRVRVNSTCRSRRHNRRVGGASRSWHLKGRAADIRVFGNIRKTARYLRRLGGGYKHYGGGLFHIDTGPRRSW